MLGQPGGEWTPRMSVQAPLKENINTEAFLSELLHPWPRDKGILLWLQKCEFEAHSRLKMEATPSTQL